MKITFISDAQIQIGNADGVKAFSGKAGETIDVPAEVAEQFVALGQARPTGITERAVKPKGETAVRK